MSSCWYQGQQQPLPLDRGWLYGDALFETQLLRHGQFRLLSLHRQRLLQGLARLGFAQLDDLAQRLEQQWQAIKAEHPQGEWVVRLQVSRQALARGYRPDALASGQIMAQVTPWHGPVLPQGLAVDVADVQLSSQPLLAGLKHCNRLEQVLARQRYTGDALELLMLNDRGQVICGTMSNLLALRGACLVTPDLSQSGVAGVMRQWIMAQWRLLGGEVDIRPLHRAELSAMDSLWLSNALHGPVAIGQLAGVTVNSLIHPVWQRLRQAYEAL